jgi:diketogulonate reductase-like aldo/keto reductase
MTGSITDCIVLNNGVEMPRLGLGVLHIGEDSEVSNAVLHALRFGYRSIDTASVYGNERAVGFAIRQSGIPRESIFVTTKVWNDAQREKRTPAAFDESLHRLGLDHVDLYLIHWPVAGCYEETWRDMESIFRSGRARAIGVSNFMPHHLENLLSVSEIAPSVNQVEFHPLLVQPDLMKACRDHGIQVVAWSPLMKGNFARQPAIVEMAGKYRKTPAQIVLRWDLQHEVVAIPKSRAPERIAENGDIFDFELAEEDMRLLDGLNEDKRFGPNPYNFDF